VTKGCATDHMMQAYFASSVLVFDESIAFNKVAT